MIDREQNEQGNGRKVKVRETGRKERWEGENSVEEEMGRRVERKGEKERERGRREGGGREKEREGGREGGREREEGRERGREVMRDMRGGEREISIQEVIKRSTRKLVATKD